MELDRERADEPTRRRRRTTTLELEILEQEFARCDKPSISERERISSLISRTDVDGPGMNSREIQVWFQNKRQAMRRAQGAYPLCSSFDDSAKTRKANEQLFGIKLTPASQEQSTPPGSFTSVDDSGSSQLGATPVQVSGLPTPVSGSQTIPERRARLVLSDVGDGHAELMFSPTPLKPSSPPRIPVLITPMRTPLSRKIASRSASSPALLGFRTPMVSKSTSFTSGMTPLDSSQHKTPLQESNAGNAGLQRSLKSLKRSRDLMTPVTQDAKMKRKRQLAHKTPSHPELGRGKENIDPKSSFSFSETPSRVAGTHTTTSSDLRRIHSENLIPSWQSHTPLTNDRRPVSTVRTEDNRASRSASSSPSLLPVQGPKKLSAEECALSLVSLAHGN